MKFGISVYCLPDRNPIQTIFFAVDNKLSAVELWDLNLSSPSIELLKLINIAGIEISLHAPLINIGDKENFKNNLELLSRTIRLAESWRAKKIVLHGGTISKSIKYDASFKVAKSLLQKVLKELEKTGTMICLENTSNKEQELFKNFSQLMDFVKLFPKENIGITFDISHAEITEGIQKGLDIFSERIKHIHLSDAKPKEGVHHLPLGSGSVDFKLLKKISHDCSIILEISPDKNWGKNILCSKSLLENEMIVKTTLPRLVKKYGFIFKEYPEIVPDSVRLVEIKEFAIKNGGIKNILIEGENLWALNLIKQEYLNKIDVICIDPPYNTGMDWLTYSDNIYRDFNDTSNLHCKWLSFIKNRMNVAYELLSDNGVLFVNIDEHEIGTLLMVCQEMFGENNIEVLIWPKTDPRFDANRIEKSFRDIKIVHEYIITCFKNRDITHLNKIMQPVFKDGEWVDVPSPLESIVKGLGTTSSAKDEIGEIFGDRLYFQTPKPMRLVKELIRSASKPNSIILDFFAGSGTTGHATMDLNKEDGGSRRFILINNNENNICKKITYERIKKVINREKYDASLTYYKIEDTNVLREPH